MSRMYYDRFRYVLLGIALLCLTSIAANYLIINFTFLCMEKDMSKQVESANGTLVSFYSYSQQQKSLIHWALAIGTTAGIVPINYAYIKLGAKWPFLVAGITSIISTMILPTAASLGYPYLLVIRVFQGLAYSADFAAIGLVCVRWAPIYQTGTFIAVLTCFTLLASVIVNPVSGMICKSFLGWTWAYYIHAAFSVVAFSLWTVFYQDDPQLHRSVSEKELQLIQRDKTKAHVERDSFVPYWALIKNKVILTVWVNALTEMVSAIFLISYTATYFQKILGYELEYAGFLVALTAGINLPIRLVMGVYSDYMHCLSARIKMCVYNSIAVGLAGLILVSIGVLPLSKPIVSVVLVTSVYTAMSFNSGAFYKCGTLVSRQYAHFVIGTIQLMKCVSLFVTPGLMWIFVDNEYNIAQWKPVFIIMGVCMIIANFLFYFVATDKPAEFTLITRESGKKDMEAIKV